MIKSLVLSSTSAILCTILTILALQISSAQVMQSTNYQIQSDSLNIGGGETASSSNYNLRDTIGEVGTGLSASESYSLSAGYRQMQEIYIALSGVGDVTMSPSIPGVTGGTANGSTTFTVITDSPSGYALTIEAENAPAMQKGADTIPDYAPGALPDLDFTVNSGEAYFGFTPEGADITPRYRDDGADCGTGGSLDTAFTCWDGVSTTAQAISSNTNPNHPDGATTTINFRVGVGDGVNQEPGFYVATTTVTALPL